MALRVSGQDDIIINLPEPLRPDELLDLEFVYGGRLPAIPPEREAIEMDGRVTSRRTTSSTFRRCRATSTQDARAGTRKATSPTTRPPRCGCACLKGIRRSRADRSTTGYPKTLPPEGRIAWMEYRFSATQPVRYLGWATSRFVHVDSASVLDRRSWKEDDAPLTGASYTFGEITVESSGMLQRRARELFDETQRVMKFYGSVLSRHPVPELHARDCRARAAGRPQSAVLRRAQPAAAGNAHFVAHRSRRTSTGFPEFFLAHETAHQWWGQAVGWKNYHEQWISEGFAQYFAAMYAEHMQEGRRVPAGDRSDGALDARPLRSGSRLSRLSPRPHPQRRARVSRARLQQGRADAAHAAQADRRRRVLPRACGAFTRRGDSRRRARKM